MSLAAKQHIFSKWFLLVHYLLITYLVSVCNKASINQHIPGMDWVYLRTTVVGLAVAEKTHWRWVSKKTTSCSAGSTAGTRRNQIAFFSYLLTRHLLHVLVETHATIIVLSLSFTIYQCGKRNIFSWLVYWPLKFWVQGRREFCVLGMSHLWLKS